MKYKPPTSQLVAEYLKGHKTATCKQISEYVCKKQKRKYVMLSGKLIKKTRSEVTGVVYTPTSKPKSKSDQYVNIAFINQDDITDRILLIESLLNSINDKMKTNLEVVETIYPNQGFEIRNISK